MGWLENLKTLPDTSLNDRLHFIDADTIKDDEANHTGFRGLMLLKSKNYLNLVKLVVKLLQKLSLGWLVIEVTLTSNQLQVKMVTL